MNNHALAISRMDDAALRLDDQQPRYGDADYELGGQMPGLDLRAIWSAIVRERLLIAIVMLLAVAAGIASIVFTKPVYRAEATIQIDSQTPAILGTEAPEVDVSKTEADRALQTQVDILTSRETADRVASSLHLASNPTFLADAGLDPSPAPEAVSEALQQRLSVSSPRDTRVIHLAYDSHSPMLAAAAANAFAESFLTGNLQRRIDANAYSRDFLQNQLTATKARLVNSERALNSYARSAGLIDASDAAGAASTGGERRSLTTASLVDMNSAFGQAHAARMQAQERWQQAQSTPLMSLPEVLANPTIQNLTQRRAELQASYEQARQRYQDSHPAIVQAKAQLDEVNRQIDSIAAGVRDSIGDQYRVAAKQESALLGSVGQLKGAALAEQDKSVRYNILKREVESNRNLYNTLLQRFNEVSAQAADTNNTISIVDRALPPAFATFPRPALNMALAVFAGLLLSLLLVFGKSKFDKKVHGPAEIERRFPLPLLGVVPLLKGPADLHQALSDPRSNMSEAHHSICFALDTANLPEHSVVLLTSSQQNEGKSTTASQLGVDLAAAGKKVLLIDADMRRGSLHRMLGLRNSFGLSDFLAEGEVGEKAPPIHFAEQHGISFLPRGRSRLSPAQLLASNAFCELLNQLRPKFDVIIIDGPPVMGLADAPRLAALADATIFLLAANAATTGHVKTALRKLAAAGADRIGIVLTKYDPARDAASDGYGYFYDYGADEPQYDEDAEEPAVGRALQMA